MSKYDYSGDNRKLNIMRFRACVREWEVEKSSEEAGVGRKCAEQTGTKADLREPPTQIKCEIKRKCVCVYAGFYPIIFPP